MQEVLGDVSSTAEIMGAMSDFLATVATVDEETFVEAVADGDARARMLRNEVAANQYLQPHAPRLRWTFERHDWVVAGFEQVAGRHADLSPGSPDVPAAVGVLRVVSERQAAGPVAEKPLVTPWRRTAPWHQLAERPDGLDEWERQNRGLLLDQERRSHKYLAEGDRVVHADLHMLNILVYGDTARFVDWGWVASGPGWVDPTLLTVRLVAAGHDCDAAERWAAYCPTWRAADRDAVTAFAVEVLGMWRLRGHFPKLIYAAQRYAQYRVAGATYE
ncbi:hypothetical protein GCM10009676_37510 [Prauserella halophila]|uniref:Aminoglycoside phosphotransferase domain-containing protein n=1 Tax=Prauserella halophila TaxID=185641 RepID=A0ABN1WEH0_9PSEU